MIEQLIHLEDITTLNNYASYNRVSNYTGAETAGTNRKKNIHKYNCLIKQKLRHLYFCFFFFSPRSPNLSSQDNNSQTSMIKL